MVGQDREPVGHEALDGVANGDHAETWKQLNGDTLLEEANALALHVGRHGKGLFAEDADATDDPCDALLTAIAEATSAPSASSWRTLMRTYARVASVTYEKHGVNGRSVLDTANARRSGCWSVSGLRERWQGAQRYRPLVIGITLFVAALFVHAAPHLSTQQPAGFSMRLLRVLSPLLVPALWGGIGACTFLAKHLSNKLSQQAYERARQQGDIVRIFLGAMIGVFAVVLFTDFGSSVEVSSDTSGGSPAPLAMGAVVIAFASGLAVKPIYAAIESLANTLASRLSDN